MTEFATEPPTSVQDEGFFSTFRALGGFFKRNLTPKTGVAVAAWRIEALILTPLSIFLIETLGRWRGAFAMSCIMSGFALLFLLLLAGEPIMADFRRWLGERKLGQWSMRIAERRDAKGAAQRALSVPAIIMTFGPFFRVVTVETFLVRKPLAFLIAVGGSFPHTMFWTGLVVGSVWELITRPSLLWLFENGASPVAWAVWHIFA
ncbi:MAG: hypothetical protein ABI559_01065 [Chloroflexota bacterium]